METGHVTTPFGRRPMTLAQVKGQMQAVGSAGQTVDKWQVLRDICDARKRLKLGDRALAVLSALLSFHPAVDLCADGNMIVFPSNVNLSARANGIAGTTLRENLAVLVLAGVIHRRDSPNGKRYARKGGTGQIETAYGFSLAPLLDRAAEFARLAQQVVAERRHVALLRERITLARRDIRKLISAAVDEGADGDWAVLEADYLARVAGIARARTPADLAAIESDLAKLKLTVLNLLECQWKEQNSDANADGIRCHVQNQNTESPFESEPRSEKEQGRDCQPARRDGLAAGHAPKAQGLAERRDKIAGPIPLGMIIRCCPEIAAYGPKGRIDNWQEMIGAASVVRSMLGVSPSAYAVACEAIGPQNAAATMACILERADRIRSPGGYLRALTAKALRGEFSLNSMLMALRQGAL